jgi:radical SAM protein with 4Fe4S-binding SPASM domain
MTNYRPRAGVWEITYACNMRCKHCGSSCGQPLPDELTSDEAMNLCDELGKLGVKRITLSGGEPFIRPDWHRIARRLTQNGVIVNAISNGWLIDEALLDKAFANGIVNIGVSLDGYGNTHDTIRKQGSWDRSVKALSLMRQKGMRTVVCTSVNKKNLEELDRLRSKLVELGVQRWQIQIATPMGNLLEHPDLIITPYDLPKIVDIAHETMQNTDLIVDLADNVGYLTGKAESVRFKGMSNNSQVKNPCSPCWGGCPAGKSVIGIRANGDINPCLAIRDSSFIEGNIRNTPLKEIWTRPNAFSELRSMSTDKLQGFCKECSYAATCLGGCTELKLTFQKHIYDNTYCTFRIEMEKATKDAESTESTPQLFQNARDHAVKQQFPQALVYVKRILDLDPRHLDALKLVGFIKFMQGDYTASLTYNETALGLAPNDLYATNGKGLCLTRLDQANQGIELLKQAVDKTDPTFMDPYYDLAVVLMEQNRLHEAREILDLGCEKNESFLAQARPLYKNIQQSENVLDS